MSPLIRHAVRCAIPIRHLAAGAAALLWAGLLHGEVPTHPSILLIVADNWLYGHSSAAGDRVVATPNFDRLTREGVSFANAFCPVPSCSPTRASMLTGRAAHELGEAVNLWSSFPSQHAVFPHELARAGYATGYTGKGWAPGNYRAGGWKQNPVGPQHRSLDEFLGQVQEGQPFFFWLGNLDTAVGQWDYRPDTLDGLDATAVRVPAHLPDTPEVRRTILAYYNGVRRLDRVIGEVRAALARHARTENTIIVCLSDNGWQLPRGLANCYDDGTHVPLVVAGPGIRGGRSVNDFVSLTELAPTELQLAGLPTPASMTTPGFVDLVRGESGSRNRDAIFVERERHANVRHGDLGYPVRGIRTRDFLLLLNLRPDRWPAGDPVKHQSVGPYGDVDNCPAKDALVRCESDAANRRYFDLTLGRRPPVELYDLRKDPAQVANVAGREEYAATQKALEARVRRWMAATHDPRVDPASDVIDRYRYWGDVNTWDEDNFDGAHLFDK